MLEKRTNNKTVCFEHWMPQGLWIFKKCQATTWQAENQVPVQCPNRKCQAHTYHHKSAGSAGAQGGPGMSSAASRRPWQHRCGNSLHCHGHRGGLLWREKKEGVGLRLQSQDFSLEEGGGEGQATPHNNWHSHRGAVNPLTSFPGQPGESVSVDAAFCQ